MDAGESLPSCAEQIHCFQPPKCCARVVDYSNSPQTHLDRLLHRCVVLTLTAIPTGYATTSMSRNQEAWHTPPMVSRAARPRCPGRPLTRRCARCISHTQW